MLTLILVTAGIIAKKKCQAACFWKSIGESSLEQLSGGIRKC